MFSIIQICYSVTRNLPELGSSVLILVIKETFDEEQDQSDKYPLVQFQKHLNSLPERYVARVHSKRYTNSENRE